MVGKGWKVQQNAGRNKAKGRGERQTKRQQKNKKNKKTKSVARGTRAGRCESKLVECCHGQSFFCETDWGIVGQQNFF